MDLFFASLPAFVIGACIAIALTAGFVKGAVGFAMPMVMISGLASVLPPETAIAALIVPTLVSNAWQALRTGVRAALDSAWKHRVYLGILLVFIMFSAQLVRVLPGWLMLLVLGVPVTGFAAAQLLGWRLHLKPQHYRRAEVIIGAVAGFIGGISGVWGPPTVAYLTALDTPKVEQMRVQGVIYGTGAVMLTLAHIYSGVLTFETLPLSIALLVPALMGLVVGFWVSDRLDQDRFRKATLLVLVIAGLNLVRRGLLG